MTKFDVATESARDAVTDAAVWAGMAYTEARTTDAVDAMHVVGRLLTYAAAELQRARDAERDPDD